MTGVKQKCLTPVFYCVSLFEVFWGVSALMEKFLENTVEKTIEISMLYDFYGELLTQRQKEILQFYYDENLSLSEIADELDISRQAVHDAIHKAERSLRTYEEKLGLFQRFRCTQQERERAGQALDSIIRQLESRGEAADAEILDGLAAVKDILSSFEE